MRDQADGERPTARRESRIERERQPRGGHEQRGETGASVQPEQDTRQTGDGNLRTETWNRRAPRDETGNRGSNRGDRHGSWNRDDNRGDNRGNHTRGDRHGRWNRDDKRDDDTRGDRHGTWNRGHNRHDDRRGDRNGSWNRERGHHGNRNGSWQRPPSHDRHGRPAYYGHGHVSRCERYGSGYRVWISGSRYPFYVPLAYYSSHRFRVGVALDLWGYYNPLGYYDYYDTGYRGVRSEFRGVVEEVDYRRDRLVVRNEETGNFVIVNLSSRRFEDVRPGDYVWIEGDWTRSSVFIAHDLRLIDDDRYDEYER